MKDKHKDFWNNLRSGSGSRGASANPPVEREGTSANPPREVAPATPANSADVPATPANSANVPASPAASSSSSSSSSYENEAPSTPISRMVIRNVDPSMPALTDSPEYEPIQRAANYQKRHDQAKAR